MKKLLVLFVVLGFISTANAGIIDLQIRGLNGQALTTPVKEITINQSDAIDFAITFTGPVNPCEYLLGLSVTLNVSGPGTLDWSHYVPRIWVAEEEMWANGPDLASAYDASLHWRGNTGTNPNITEQGNSILEVLRTLGQKSNGEEQWIARNIWLQCNGKGTVNITMTNFTEYGTRTVVIDEALNEVAHSFGNGIIIHSVPEPGTLLLLGLGGLFLRRKKLSV